MILITRTTIIFNPDSTFKYRLGYDVMHDIACGKYRLKNDTIFLFYETDLHDTMCNNVMDISMYDSTVKILDQISCFIKIKNFISLKMVKYIIE